VLKGDARAAERFFRKVMNAVHNQTPRVINVNALILRQLTHLLKTKLFQKLLNYDQYLNNIVDKTTDSLNDWLIRNGMSLI